MTGAEIRQLRMALGMTQVEFGLLAGLTGKDLYVAQGVSRWERGIRRPSKFSAERISRAAARHKGGDA